VLKAVEGDYKQPTSPFSVHRLILEMTAAAAAAENVVGGTSRPLHR